MWGLIIFLFSEILFQLGLDPRSQWDCEGDFPPTIVIEGSRANGDRFWSTPSGGLGAAPLKIYFLFKFLVKYFNFIVNLNHSLCHIVDGISYVNLESFVLEGNPQLYMKELYYDYVLFLQKRIIKE